MALMQRAWTSISSFRSDTPRTESLSISVANTAIIGLMFIVARIIYARGYMQVPEKRGPGAGISGVSLIVLVLGALVGGVRALL